MLAYDNYANFEQLPHPIHLTELVQHTLQENLDSLLLPMIAALSNKSSWLVLLNPPNFYDRQYLTEASVDLNKVWVLHTENINNQLNLVRKVITADTCHTLICWQTPSDNRLKEFLKETDIETGTQCILVSTTPQ